MHNKTFYIMLLIVLSHENINKHNINSTFTERSSIPSNQHITISCKHKSSITNDNEIFQHNSKIFRPKSTSSLIYKQNIDLFHPIL